MKIDTMSKDQQVYNLLKKGLDASTLRKQAVAENLANINTKGYKRKYVTFEENFKQNIDDLELKTTSDKHMQLKSAAGEMEMKTDNSSSMREDGNNVDIENEIVNEAANTLMYNALVTQANNRLSITKYIISGR